MLVLEKIRPWCLSLLFLGLFSPQIRADTLIATNSGERVAMVELFTSESCSSCPPADRWFSQLKDAPGLWTKFVPVVFHVDYWNHLGWKDELSSELMTKRQVALAKQWPSANVYTPGVVLNGQEWTAWRNSRLPSAQEKSEWKITLTSLGKGLVKASVLRKGGKGTYLLRVAQLGIGLNTKVTAGENSGRSLDHDFVVLDWNSHSLKGGSNEFTIPFKAVERAAKRLAVVAWIEEEGNPAPLQSVGGFL